MPFCPDRARHRPRRCVPAVLAGILAALPLPAAAHAILLASEPAAGGTVPAGTVTLHLHFNSRIDHGRSRLTLSRSGHPPAALRIARGSAVEELDASATLTPGRYTLRWQVLAIDGHITRGDVPFTVSGP